MNVPVEDRYTRAMGWDLFETAPSGVVRVALPVPVDQLFDYEVPEDLAREAEVGRRVRAPFGSRRLTGVIRGSRSVAEAAVGWPPPPRRVATAPASTAPMRLRPTT